MRVEAFFSELRSFAVALEDDCASLRKAVVAAQPRFPDGCEGAADAVRVVHDETNEVIDSVDALEGRLYHGVSMGAVAEAVARIVEATQQQLSNVEQELAQYGFVPLPSVEHLAQVPAAMEAVAPATAALNDTAATVGHNATDMNSTFVRDAAENGEDANKTAEDSTANITSQIEAVVAPAVSKLDGVVSAPPMTPAKSMIPTLSAITPLRARLMPATAVESPKTPSLEDVGLSAAVMSLLQPGQTKIPTASTTAPRSAVKPVSKLGAAAPVASAMSRLGAASPDTSLDLGSFQITSVPLKTPDVKAAKAAAMPLAPTSVIKAETPVAPSSTMCVAPAAASVADASPMGSPHFEVPTSAALSSANLLATQLAPLDMGEYEALPGFVKTQLEFDAANGVLAALRECIQTSELKPSDVQLTATQLQNDLGLGAKTKVALLVLLKTKRLHLKGTENGEHVYGLAL